ncbi:disease resistance protein RUN1-like [Eucalyptus grandis]|uniref:disease resistance protein RUN1-like n=1 Tax=Eucalyptus grandis TaxID=71139 RepID=UPI00192EFE25|nr:disease resistance protein RUN1-like [Eucalyptus grandis]
MANTEAGTSGDVAPASGCEYQVFLNFRGFDTRHGFTDFLYNHLVDVGIRVFRDDDELNIGEVIGENLVSAINNSIIYIPIFSKNYASSKCNALSEHERESPDQVKVWKEALAKSFLKDVRETSSTKEGIIRLQKKLLSDIGRPESAKQIEDIEEGMRRIRATLSNKKVLIVLDDVDKKVLIKNLMGNSKLYLGSRVIITTRNIDILQVEGSEVKIEQYEMQMMDDSLALQLFCRHAFHRDYPLDDYRELSRKIVSLMGGLPLAIEVVGYLLKYKEDKTIWEEKIIKLTEVLDKGILDVLKISYDEQDEFQKKISLDIACFFFNEKKTDAIYMWESCKFYPRGGIEVLTKRCLIKTLDDDKFWMHDHLIALGKQIVYEENQDDPAKRSRLWNAEEALQIIGTEERKDKVQALEIDGLDDNIEIKSEDFKSLPNLRFLRLGHGTFVGDFSKCRSNLRWISWRHPENFRANNIYLDHLIVFKLDISILKDDSKAWDLIKRARNLKVLSLTRCHGITRIPDFSKCLGLEKLTLKLCSRLKRIESFIGDLRPLIELEVERGLTDLPEEVGALSKLKHFLLQGCSGLIELPGSLGNLTSLAEIGELSYLRNLKTLEIERCNVLTNVEGLHKLRSLEYLKVIGCTSLGRFIGASGTNVPDDCSINIEGISTNRYGEEILPDISNEV